MTTTNSTPVRSEATPKTWMLRRTTLAGFAFSLSWLVGLSVFAASTTVVSSGAQVVAAYSGRTAGGVLQYLFTEGLPPVAILIVVGALARRARGTGHPRLGAVTWIVALVASIVSFTQFVLGVVLVTAAVPAGDTASSALLSDSVTRLDGAKMLLFAGMAVSSLIYLVRARPGRLIWLRVVSALLAVTIVISGLGYLLTVTPLATAADASLPLLLAWVTGFAIVLGRGGH